jgi:hypothetical protein
VGKTPTPISGVTPPTPVDNHSEHNAGTVSVSAAKSTHLLGRYQWLAAVANIKAPCLPASRGAPLYSRCQGMSLCQHILMLQCCDVGCCCTLGVAFIAKAPLPAVCVSSCSSLTRWGDIPYLLPLEGRAQPSCGLSECLSCWYPNLRAPGPLPEAIPTT